MIIIASKPGQLGNSLFLYAHFIAFALENNYKIINPSFNQYSEYFDSTSGSILCPFPKKKGFSNNRVKRTLSYNLLYYCGRIIYRLKINNRLFKCIYLDWQDSFNLCNSEVHFNSKLIFTQGWSFRCTEYVSKHFSEIIKFFKPKNQFSERINHLISNAKKNCDVLIGMHIRHGDYKNFENGKYFYNMQQYKEIMLKVKSLFPEKKILFFVCTNSKEETSGLNELNIIRGTNHELEDMYAFAQCHYLLGPPSTYTMWASFYGQVPLYQIHEINSDFSINNFKVVMG